MTSRSLPYYRFYVMDYRANRAVQRLTYVERGLYRELLDECWIEGAIPDDIAKLAEICGCPVGVMAEAWPNLKPRFTASHGLDGMYLINHRLESERTEVDKVRAVRSLAGKQGGRPKANESNGKQTKAKRATEQLIAEQSSSSSKSSEPADAAPEGARPGSFIGPVPCQHCGVGPSRIHAPTCPNREAVSA